MFKQMKKKLNNKKGFTLAELLVVIAILAILIAIAIPVFSNMVADSNLRVNQANVRSVRSAAVAHILTRPDEKDNASTPVELNKGIGEGKGWVAVANVDNNGDVKNLKVFVVQTNISSQKNGIAPGELSPMEPLATGSDGFEVLSDNVNEPFATLRPTTKKSDGTASNVYTVQAVITDLDPKN